MWAGGGVASLTALLLAVVVAFICGKQVEAKPHIILMVLDDIGRTDTGIYGESNIPVPRLKGIANEGVIFENFYTQTVCSPTRSSVLTGRYPFRFGMQHTTTQGPGMSAAVPLDTPMIPALLAGEGYERHAIGKWHCGYATWEHTPTKRGFQSYTGYLQAQGDYYKHTFSLEQLFKAYGKVDGLDFWENTRPMHEAVGNYSLNIYQAAMTKILRGYAKRHETPDKQRENPLFIYMAHQTVHIPIQFRKEEQRCAHLKHSIRRQYCNMMVELDDAVGEMVDQLKELNMWDNTLILTLTDNGGMVSFAKNADGTPHFPASQGSNYPLRGSKMTLFDGGVRALGFAAGGFIPQEGRGRRVFDLAHVVDFSATILTLGGVLPARREHLRLDGHNLFELIANRPGARSARDHVPINVIFGGKKYSAVRFGNYKLIVDDYLNHPAQGWFDENGDLKEAPPAYANGQLQLFDLESDPEERKDIAKERPHLVKYGQELLRMYVEGGDYMEPQDNSRMYVKAYPPFHGGVWKPFMDVKEWNLIWNRDKAKAARNARKYAEDDIQEEDDVIDYFQEQQKNSDYISFEPSEVSFD